MIQKVKKLAEKAVAKYGKNYKENRDPILLLIMTSETENDIVYEELEDNQFFGYQSTYVFPQSDLPVFSKDGRILLKSKFQIHKMANGDGGIFQGIRKFKLQNLFEENGITKVHFMNCDSLFKKPCDPVFLYLANIHKKDILIKSFRMNHKSERFRALAMNKLGELTTIDENHKNYYDTDELGNRVNDLAHSVDCIMTTEFLNKKSMTKKFNFAESYTIKDWALEVYSPIQNKYFLQKDNFSVFLGFYEIYKFCDKIGIYEDEHCQCIYSEDSLDKSLKMFYEKNRKKMEKLGVQGLKDTDEAEISMGLYYSFEDLDVINKNNIVRNGNEVYLKDKR